MHRSWFCTHFVSGWCVYLWTCDLQVYCFLFPKGLCFMLKNMCSETKPAGSRSTTVMSSFLLLGRQVARGLLRKKAGGFYFLCVCAHIVVKIYITYTQPQYCTSLFHLPTRHCGVSDVRPDYLWGNNGAVKVAEINEAFFFFCSRREAPMARFYGCTCCLSLMLSSPRLPNTLLHAAWP